jgi:hypothetical protein
MRGNLESAAHMYEQLRRGYRSLGDIRGDCGAAINLANLEYDRAQTKRAIALTHERSDPIEPLAFRLDLPLINSVNWSKTLME